MNTKVSCICSTSTRDGAGKETITQQTKDKQGGAIEYNEGIGPVLSNVKAINQEENMRCRVVIVRKYIAPGGVKGIEREG